MNRSYNDIISRISSPPLWWQEGGIPRYEVFDPTTSTGIYTSEVAYAEIACQMTGVRFFVTIEGGTDRQVANSIRKQTLCYGDPPNTPNVSAFTTSTMLRVIQYWYRCHEEYVVDGMITDWPKYDEWRRDPALEVVFE
jgi:hypothetical protein